MENFQRSSAPHIIKYNCVVLFLCQLYLLINYASKYFLIDHHYKRCVIIYWSSHKWQNLVIFAQRAKGKKTKNGLETELVFATNGVKNYNKAEQRKLDERTRKFEENLEERRKSIRYRNERLIN